MGTQFSNLLELEKDGNIVDSDLEIYAKHLKNLSEDFKALFKDLQRMRVPDWIVTLFDFYVQNADINSQLQDELTDMRVDLEAQSLFEHKNLRDSAMQIPLLNTRNLVQLLSRFYLHSQIHTCLNLVVVMQIHS